MTRYHLFGRERQDENQNHLGVSCVSVQSTQYKLCYKNTDIEPKNKSPIP